MGILVRWRPPHTPPRWPQELAHDLLERFTRYVRIDTQSAARPERSPSTPGQLELGRLLVTRARADAGSRRRARRARLCDGDARRRRGGGVRLPPTAPAVGLIAHLDTSPDVPGEGVEPIVHRDYDGDVLELPREETRLDPESDARAGGRSSATTSSRPAATRCSAPTTRRASPRSWPRLHTSPRIQSAAAALRVAFHPGRGDRTSARSLFDLDRFGAGCAYTLDGSELGELQDESFSALEALVTIHGVDVHPGQAMGQLVSALRLASKAIARSHDELTARADGEPRRLHPSHTS